MTIALITQDRKSFKTPHREILTATSREQKQQVLDTLDTLKGLCERWKNNFGIGKHFQMIRVGRTPTGRISVSENQRDQKRTGHAHLEISLLKPKMIEAFLDLEQALRAYPFLAHPFWKLGTSANTNRDNLSVTLNGHSLVQWSGTNTEANDISWLLSQIENVSLPENAPLWIVGKDVFPAQSPEQALWLSTVMQNAGKKDPKVKPLKRIPNVGPKLDAKDLEAAYRAHLKTIPG